MTVHHLPRPARRQLPKATDRLTMNGTLDVSPLCIGAVADPDVIGAAFDAGVNFFFVTADMHWPYYEETRRGLAALFARAPGVRDEVVVASVAYVTQPEFCHVPFVEVVEAVPGLDRIDVTVAGGSYTIDFATRAEQFALHRARGVRAFGTSFHERALAARAIEASAVDVAFIRYNALHRGAEQDLFPLLTRQRRTLVYNFTSTHGCLPPAMYDTLGLSPNDWRPAHTDYYRFILGRLELDGVLCAPRTLAELRALLHALDDGPLTEEEATYIRDLADLTLGEAALATGGEATQAQR